MLALVVVLHLVALHYLMQDVPWQASSTSTPAQPALQMITIVPSVIATAPDPQPAVRLPQGDATVRERKAERAERANGPAPANERRADNAMQASSLPAPVVAPSPAVPTIPPPIPSLPPTSTLPQPNAPTAGGAAQANIGRSGQAGGAAWRDRGAASESVASRMATGIAAAAIDSGHSIVEEQSGSARLIRVRAGGRVYCLRTKDPSLKIDPFNKELAVPINCPP